MSEEDVSFEFVVGEKRVEVFIVCGYRGGSKRGKFRPFGFKVKDEVADRLCGVELVSYC